ncbi:flagellar basal-body rod protein FlgB [Thermoclostridium stercorarium subsp. thermolacticum DSM 2910]|uniref:Flagellar basal body rod protein FlgB n=2 Tax=Thermoclostridium stercorarium TaxID=1510 RepID=A0A1B1YIJ8_THEST|nr:FlgB [Thermoclostridium stercorarium subsp. stercorarium DSM 8532]ANW98003.1 flagellar basal-body rod protein FlgB [Thermoclostridium stercorarium subsp. thermolacticum DSM 2910]ANX00552.1 flagellar basal-body rod protein FlgB [Thermoclostridium stercorarium subsp. leptospartum DSM 9219]
MSCLVTKLLFADTRIEKALDVAWKRNEIISENIANVDTPGYKRKDVQFENYLNSELKHGSISNFNSKLSNNDGIRVVYDNINYSYRLDGNNVDIEREMAIMAENTIRYYTLINRISSQFNKIRTIIKGG